VVLSSSMRLFPLAAIFALPSAALAWDASGHLAITLLALDRLKAVSDAPAWIQDETTRQMIAWQSGEPDRWRGTRTPTLKHDNDPDHYIDLEDLTPYGITLRTMPMLRHEYVKALGSAREKAPEKFKPVNPAMDAAKTLEYPGFLPQAIMEHYEKLRSALTTLRILEGLADAASDRRKIQIEQAKSNVRYHMGVLSHFVGDAAQPLHTTTHHHGWVGENPSGYTTERTIHAYIDGGVVTLHGLNYDTMKTQKPGESPPLVADPQNPWGDVLTHIERSFAEVEPLYAMKKSGELEQEKGKAFIRGRMEDGARMLGDLYAAAWKASVPTESQIADYLKYEAKP
jgi:hypothetical protein